MRLRFISVLAFLFFIGCSAYKQLQPKPELSSAEKGYIELKDGKKDFELKKEKRYFIQFPSAEDKNYYLVLSIPAKKSFSSFLTSQLTDKKRPGEKITDESTCDTMSVYPIENNGSGYYLIIESIPEDVIFNVDYRYVPQWRFKFENKHASFKEILENNRVDREAYNSIGPGKHLQGTNFPKMVKFVKDHYGELENVYNELLAIESIFPPSILNSKDEAYQNYLTLKSSIEEEMTFQKNYLLVLNFFGKESQCDGNPGLLMESVDLFIEFFSKKDSLPSPVVSEAQNVINERLKDVVPFYEQKLTEKDDAAPFDEKSFMTSSLYRVATLYNDAGLAAPQEYTVLSKFVKDFDTRARGLQSASDSLAKINESIEKLGDMPDDKFFAGVVKKVSAIKTNLVKPLDESYGKFNEYSCKEKLNSAITGFTETFNTKAEHFQEASSLVPLLNSLKEQRDFSGMLGHLTQKMHLDFLIPKYKPLDKMSVDEQANQIEISLNDRNWPKAEEGLRKLYEDTHFLNPEEIYPVKAKVVGDLEDSLYTKIDRVSRQRIVKFLEDNIGVLENVDSLYADSVFLPVYNVTFATGSRNDLLKRKTELIEHLAKMKENEFPAKAITLLYKQFTSNPNKDGVLKARAVVAHGKYYKGEDKKVKLSIAECDPLTAKWIVKPKQYRRVFALPVTDRRVNNKYVVRMYIDIPTDAKFPVFDVNIKLPKEIADNAGSKQWYESMTLNKVPLKNEGRFTITAPSASNDYECQISPVQMKKEKANILEITFTHNTYKVHPVSIMVQKPIIKKN